MKCPSKLNSDKFVSDDAIEIVCPYKAYCCVHSQCV